MLKGKKIVQQFCFIFITYLHMSSMYVFTCMYVSILLLLFGATGPAYTGFRVLWLWLLSTTVPDSQFLLRGTVHFRLEPITGKLLSR